MATAATPALMRRLWRALPALLPLAAAGSAYAAEAQKEPQAQEGPAVERESQAENKEEPLSLTPSQQQAVGIRVEAPLPLKSAPQIEAYGLVLDPVALVSAWGRIESLEAASAAASAEAARAETLYRNGAQASLKALQASHSQAIEAAAQSRAAELNFALEWGPLASWPEAQRRVLLEQLSKGQRLLVRAEVPGRRLGNTIAPRALLEADGANVVARVLGPLPRIEAQVQSAGWLLEVEHPPEGLGPGARVPVRLQAALMPGLLVPATALLYSADGAYVYRQVNVRGAAALHFSEVVVRPLARVGDAWLVDGLGRTDQVVVQGAGVLWSLRGISNFSAAEEEHD